jgi:hypothetical protein
MISYRFKRRAFLSAVSGGVGLKILLRNMEASAQTTKSPARLLVSHWPVGIVAGSGDGLFTATSGSVGGSPGLQPFADAGLGADMTVLKGISTPGGAGGSHEGGTPALCSGVPPRGTRSGQAESDDAYCDGPSFEQILLANVPALKAPGSTFSYQNAGCDTRTDFGEVSTKCLSYSAMKQQVGAVSGPGMENVPLMPTLSPVTLYNNLFANFVPTSANTDYANAPRVANATLTNLVRRRSVLDFAKQELDGLRRMGPADARMKLDNHYNAILQMENSITNAINTGYPDTGGGGMGGNMGQAGSMGMGQGGRGGSVGMGGMGGAVGMAGRGGAGGGGQGGGGTTGQGGGAGTGTVVVNCRTKPAAPTTTAVGSMDGMSGAGNSYGDPTRGATEDAPRVAQVGAAHMAVFKAAFICDVIRCGTLLWAPGTNHVGFRGLFPNQANTIYMHHPQSHKIQTSHTTASNTLTSLDPSAQFLFAVQKWFFQQLADNLKDWKASIDGNGNSLLDFTVVPYVTEVAATGHERSRMPAMIIGGKSLGFAHNRYQAGQYSVNQFWGTIGQAFGYTSTSAPFAAPISGLWTRPA